MKYVRGERKGVIERNSERGREGGRERERIERERARKSDGTVCMDVSPAPLSKQEDDGVAGVAGTKDDLPEITPHESAHRLYASKGRERARNVGESANHSLYASIFVVL